MFSDSLKKLRKAKNLTQIELAKKLNVANGTVGNWESGNRQPDYETLKKIAEFFNVTTDYLLGREQTFLKTNSLTENQKKGIRLAEQLSAEQMEKVIEYASFLKSKEEKENAYIAAFGGDINLPQNKETPKEAQDIIDKTFDVEE